MQFGVYFVDTGKQPYSNAVIDSSAMVQCHCCSRNSKGCHDEDRRTVM